MSEQFRGILNNLIASAAWDAIKRGLGCSLVTALATALWEKLRHGSLDWYAIAGMFILTLVVVIWIFWKRPTESAIKPSAEKPQQRVIPEPKLKIHRATYASELPTEVDVTDALQNTSRDALLVTVDHNLGGLIKDDPAFGIRKRFDVTYSYGNDRKIDVSRTEYPAGEGIMRLALPEDSEIKRLMEELEKAKAAISTAKSRRYPRQIFTIQDVTADPPTDSPGITFKDKVRVILTNTIDRDVNVWTPLWESREVRADGSPPGSRIQLEGPKGWKAKDWGPEVSECRIPIGKTFTCYVALLPPDGQSITMRIKTRSHLGTALFPVKIDGVLYEESVNLG